MARSVAHAPTEDSEHDYPVNPRESIDKITWSYSKRSMLEQCARRYYYEYYGANKRTAKGEKEKDSLHLLKAVQNRFERAGSILHLVIRVYLQKKRNGDVWTPSRAVDWARGLFEEDIRYSRRYPDGNHIAQVTYPPTLLREYHYRQPDADRLCNETSERLVHALGVFFSAQCDIFRRDAISTNSVIEGRISLKGLPCKVGGQVDLAYLDGDHVNVIDWKMGGEEGTGDDSLQLAVYGLWALDHFHCSVDALRVMKVHLSGGDISTFRAGTEVLASAQARIIQDAERMAVMNYYGNIARKEAFTPCSYVSVCRLCSFEKVCHA